MYPQHPVFVPSKGRYQPERAGTVKAFLRHGVPFKLVVEPQEADAYRALVGDERVLVLPFSNLGEGSIPARNWIRDYAISTGATRHWCIDDSLSGVGFYRLWKGRRVPCHGGTALRVCEAMTDRYENVGISGLNYDMFVPAKTPVPYTRNTHVYSTILVNHAMPYRWRGRFNEDTDLCLQALANGWCTISVNVVCAKKSTTMTVPGGNEDLYRGDGEENARDTYGRYEMTRSLEHSWPGVVKTIRRFGRFQHSVNWRAFDTPLRFRPDWDLTGRELVDEFGMTLLSVQEPKSPRILALRDEYAESLATAVPFDEHWTALPAFIPYDDPAKLTVTFRTNEEREAFVGKLGVMVDKRFVTGPGWSCWYPARGRDDPASLFFGPTEETV